MLLHVLGGEYPLTGVRYAYSKHKTQNLLMANSDSGGFIFKTGLFAILAGLSFWIFSRSSGDKKPEMVETSSTDTKEIPSTTQEAPAKTLDWQPKSTTGEVVSHTWYTLSYSEEHEQAEWVAYELTQARLNSNWIDRGGMTFMPDPEVRTESATPRDYTGSGYDRGHLCPAADMAFDSNALRETFYMSNISPQAKGFNTGVWKEMESLTRTWARKYGKLYVVTGPLLSRNGIKQIGFSKVTVPVGFYKVMYAPKQNIAIGFVVPNQKSDKTVMEYSFNIDYIEKLSGLDFFPTLLSGEQEKVESKIDASEWPVKN